MIQHLLDHIKRYCIINDDVAEAIRSSCGSDTIRKKQLIVQSGSPCSTIHFVTSGCLRMFYIDDKGVEQTIQFALENWWMTDLDAFNNRRNASFSIQAIEDSTVILFNKKDFDHLLLEHPVMEKYFRRIYEKAYSASLFRMMFVRLSKDESYQMFCDRYPEFVQRIPQKLLASFLGFTPEYLSELRKKKAATR
jgi:CRP-like cAMP-binding protein